MLTKIELLKSLIGKRFELQDRYGGLCILNGENCRLIEIGNKMVELEYTYDKKQ
jgi:hypothetical protein